MHTRPLCMPYTVRSVALQLAEACSSTEENKQLVEAAREEVHAVLSGREQRCQALRAEVGGFLGDVPGPLGTQH